MKQSVLIITALLAMSFGYFDVEKTQLQVSPKDGLQNLPVIKFEKIEHDFGTITKGTLVETEFFFTNTGNAPLVISEARSTCGCTVPEKPEGPILPGQKGKIKVTFNGSGSGKVTKVITLTTNTKSKTETVSIKANVTAEQK